MESCGDPNMARQASWCKSEALIEQMGQELNAGT
jgi:hypothetical protein